MAYQYPQQGQVRAPKDTTIAYILWFFLGAFGVHRFYLGQTRKAVILLVLGFGGGLLTGIFIGIPMVIAWFILWVMDAFALGDDVRKYNQGMLT